MTDENKVVELKSGPKKDVLKQCHDLMLWHTGTFGYPPVAYSVGPEEFAEIEKKFIENKVIPGPIPDNQILVLNRIPIRIRNRSGVDVELEVATVRKINGG